MHIKELRVKIMEWFCQRMDINRMPRISLELRISKQRSQRMTVVEIDNSFRNEGKVWNKMKGEKCQTTEFEIVPEEVEVVVHFVL
jgi:hypothetical protein